MEDYCCLWRVVDHILMSGCRLFTTASVLWRCIVLQRLQKCCALLTILDTVQWHCTMTLHALFFCPLVPSTPLPSLPQPSPQNHKNFSYFSMLAKLYYVWPSRPRDSTFHSLFKLEQLLKSFNEIISMRKTGSHALWKRFIESIVSLWCFLTLFSK